MENQGPKGRWTLAIRLSAVALLMNVFVITGATIWVFQSRDHYIQHATIATKNLSMILEKSITAFFEKVDLTMLSVGDEVVREYSNGGIIKPLIEEIMRQYDVRLPEGNGLRITDAQGNIKYAVSNVVNAVAAVSDRWHFTEARDNLNGGLVVEGPIYGRMSQKWLITLGRRLSGKNGEFIGEIHESIPISFFDKIMSDIDIGSHGIISLRNKKFELVVGHFGSQVEKAATIGTKNTIVPQLKDIIDGDRKVGTFYHKTTGADRIARIVTCRNIQNTPFFIIVALAEMDYLAPWRRELVIVCLLVGAFFLLSTGSFTFVYLNWRVQLRRANDHAQAMSEAKEAAELALVRTEAILSSAGQGIYGVNRDGTTAFVNPKASEILGWSAEELLGRHQHDIIHHTKSDGTQYPKEECPILMTMISGVTTNVKGEVFWRKDGTSFPVEYAVSPLIRGKNVVGAVFVFYDTSAQIKREESLRQAHESAEFANNAKSRFLATMSHEIRTPVTSIMSIIDLLHRTPLNEEQSEYIEILTSSSQTLLTILNDILDISKIEAGKLSIEEVEFCPADAIKGVFDLCHSAATVKNLAVSLSGTEALPARVISDPVRLKQILHNLINNAIKFTESGTVAIRIDVKAATAKTAVMVIEVQDTGIGIDERQVSRLFKPFSQADSSMTRRFGGTGLGLSITKRLVDLIGGEIGVISTLGTGSCFHVSLPVKVVNTHSEIANTPLPKASPVVPPRPLKILLAEDNAINQKLVKTMLQKFGHSVAVAANGREAVAAIVESDFDAVLMDMQMPEMGGDEATVIIRKMPAPRCNIPVIALTADVMAEDRARYHRAGINSLVAKPIDWETLSLVLMDATKQ